MGERGSIERILSPDFRLDSRRSYEPITLGTIVVVLSIKELLAWAGVLGLFGLVVTFRQIGGGSRENGRDEAGNPRYRFRVKVEKAEKEK